MNQPMSGATAGAAAAYAGDLSVREAWQKLSEDSKAIMIDVRSDAEWTFVGVPDLASLAKQPVFVQWQVFPGMIANPNFVTEVAAKVLEKDAPLLFLCRSGGRSRSAAIALTTRGYKHCYNIVGGFEGDLDAEGHRGRAGGWKAAGLPWRQR